MSGKSVRKDVRLPQQLQRAMAAEAEATREARAKVNLYWFLRLYSISLFVKNRQENVSTEQFCISVFSIWHMSSLFPPIFFCLSSFYFFDIFPLVSASFLNSLWLKSPSRAWPFFPISSFKPLVIYVTWSN
jgi:hypothetical protein